MTSHLLKSGSRALMNTSPEPVSNLAASVTEDVVVVGGLSLAFAHPWLALTLVVGISVGLALRCGGSGANWPGGAQPAAAPALVAGPLE